MFAYACVLTEAGLHAKGGRNAGAGVGASEADAASVSGHCGVVTWEQQYTRKEYVNSKIPQSNGSLSQQRESQIQPIWILYFGAFDKMAKMRM